MNTRLLLRLISLLGILLITSCSHKTYIGSSNLYGKWTGEGRFNSSYMNGEIGIFPIVFEIHNDNTVTGSIGDAKIIDSKIVRHVKLFEKDGNTIKCKLEVKLNNNFDFTRDQFDIIMYVEGKTEIRTNFFYGSKVGGGILRKSND